MKRLTLAALTATFLAGTGCARNCSIESTMGTGGTSAGGWHVEFVRGNGRIVGWWIGFWVGVKHLVRAARPQAAASPAPQWAPRLGGWQRVWLWLGFHSGQPAARRPVAVNSSSSVGTGGSAAGSGFGLGFGLYARHRRHLGGVGG